MLSVTKTSVKDRTTHKQSEGTQCSAKQHSDALLDVVGYYPSRGGGPRYHLERWTRHPTKKIDSFGFEDACFSYVE